MPPIQLGTTVRNAMLEAYEAACNNQTVTGGTGSGGSITGTATQPILRILTGAMPATPATAQTGTLLATITLPADWTSAAAAGVKALSGTWQATAAASGTTGYYRILDNAAATVMEQGTCGQQVVISTSALTAANGNVLTFAATTGVVVGMNVAGTGIPVGASVVATTGTTVTLSMTSTAGVANAASITFTPDLVVDNASINSGQTVTITSKSITAPNA